MPKHGHVCVAHRASAVRQMLTNPPIAKRKRDGGGEEITIDKENEHENENKNEI